MHTNRSQPLRNESKQHFTTIFSSTISLTLWSLAFIVNWNENRAVDRKFQSDRNQQKNRLLAHRRAQRGKWTPNALEPRLLGSRLMFRVFASVRRASRLRSFAFLFCFSLCQLWCPTFLPSPCAVYYFCLQPKCSKFPFGIFILKFPFVLYVLPAIQMRSAVKLFSSVCA